MILHWSLAMYWLLYCSTGGLQLGLELHQREKKVPNLVQWNSLREVWYPLMFCQPKLYFSDIQYLKTRGWPGKNCYSKVLPWLQKKTGKGGYWLWWFHCYRKRVQRTGYNLIILYSCSTWNANCLALLEIVDIPFLGAFLCGFTQFPKCAMLLKGLVDQKPRKNEV